MKPPQQRGKTPRKTPSRKQTFKETDPVEVYCRIRPLDSSSVEKCVRPINATTLQISPPESSVGFRNGNLKQVQYTFKLLFDEDTSQKAVFDQIAYPLVSDLLHNRNGLLFAYGITSSGKTHTMTGTPLEQGILPRTLDVIFNSIGDVLAKKYVFKPDKMNSFDIQAEADAMIERQRKDLMPKLMTPKTPGGNTRGDFLDGERVRETAFVDGIDEDSSYAVFVSYVEIYNDYAFDLLEDLPYDPITGYKAPQSRNLREDRSGNMFVHCCTEVEVRSTEEAYEVLLKGQKRRKVAHTALNAESSRSHSVFNIRIVQAPLDPLGEEVLQDKDRVYVSQLSLVDLAGSERSSRTKSAGDRLKEAGNINKSLMSLRTCIEILRENQTTGSNKMVPYRDSKITHLFKNYFDGEGKVRMIVCVNPKADEFDETLHVMRFAEMTQEVQVARPQNVRFDIGLTPGRRRFNDDYKNAVKRCEDEGVDPAVVLAPSRLYDIGPPFPILELFHADDTITLTHLMQYLHVRQMRRHDLLTDFTHRQDTLRTYLVEMENDNQHLRQRVTELEAYLGTHNSERGKMDKRLRNVEEQSRKLQTKCQNYELEIQELNRQLEEQGIQIKRANSEKNRIKNDYENKLVANNKQWEQNLDVELQRMEEECGSQIMSREHKLQLLRNVLDVGAVSSSSATTTRSGLISAPRTPRVPPPVAPKPHYTGGSRGVTPAKSETDLTPRSSLYSHGRFRTGAAAVAQQRTNTPYGSKLRAKSPPARSTAAAVPSHNTRRHRRSRSTGDNLWLDHRPMGTVDTGTILKPNIRKKKSVSKLEMKDTKTANKYLLTTNRIDSEGEVETRMYKGDVLSTAGGGAAVVFNDVETVKSKSPGDRKRRTPDLRPEDFSGEWTDTEDRCNIAIEGHGLKKRPRSSRESRV
ncbi:kinesin-like protein KIF23 [Tubulanus polymorphus]|uniref:kinesin-like protein KIF23 n=1 Tax=Tubulanus polymorphus TaxID=672921 RepID=UPI003DA5113C